jgi:hypothetical protein
MSSKFPDRTQPYSHSNIAAAHLLGWLARRSLRHPLCAGPERVAEDRRTAAPIHAAQGQLGRDLHPARRAARTAGQNEPEEKGRRATGTCTATEKRPDSSRSLLHTPATRLPPHPRKRLPHSAAPAAADVGPYHRDRLPAEGLRLRQGLHPRLRGAGVISAYLSS